MRLEILNFYLIISLFIIVFCVYRQKINKIEQFTNTHEGDFTIKGDLNVEGGNINLGKNNKCAYIFHVPQDDRGLLTINRKSRDNKNKWGTGFDLISNTNGDSDFRFNINSNLNLKSGSLTNAIENMGRLANFISSDGSNFNIPGNLLVNGNTTVNGDTKIKGNNITLGPSTDLSTATLRLHTAGNDVYIDANKSFNSKINLRIKEGKRGINLIFDKHNLRAYSRHLWNGYKINHYVNSWNDSATEGCLKHLYNCLSNNKTAEGEWGFYSLENTNVLKTVPAGVNNDDAFVIMPYNFLLCLDTPSTIRLHFYNDTKYPIMFGIKNPNRIDQYVLSKDIIKLSDINSNLESNLITASKNTSMIKGTYGPNGKQDGNRESNGLLIKYYRD